MKEPYSIKLTPRKNHVSWLSPPEPPAQPQLTHLFPARQFFLFLSKKNAHEIMVIQTINLFKSSLFYPFQLIRQR